MKQEVVKQERFEEPRDKRKLIVKTEEEMESQEQAEAAVKQEALLSVPPVVKQDAAMPVLPVVKKEARFEEPMPQWGRCLHDCALCRRACPYGKQKARCV